MAQPARCACSQMHPFKLRRRSARHTFFRHAAGWVLVFGGREHTGNDRVQAAASAAQALVVILGCRAGWLSNMPRNGAPHGGSRRFLRRPNVLLDSARRSAKALHGTPFRRHGSGAPLSRPRRVFRLWRRRYTGGSCGERRSCQRVQRAERGSACGGLGGFARRAPGLCARCVVWHRVGVFPAHIGRPVFVRCGCCSSLLLGLTGLEPAACQQALAHSLLLCSRQPIRACVRGGAGCTPQAHPRRSGLPATSPAVRGDCLRPPSACLYTAGVPVLPTCSCLWHRVQGGCGSRRGLRAALPGWLRRRRRLALSASREGGAAPHAWRQVCSRNGHGAAPCACRQLRVHSVHAGGGAWAGAAA